MKKKKVSTTPPSPEPQQISWTTKWVPWIVIGILGIYLLSAARPPAPRSAFRMTPFGQLPVLNGGRIKPLDTVARVSLLLISGKQSVRSQGRMPAIEWLANVMFKASEANDTRVFEINDPDVLGLIGIQQSKERFFSFNQLHPHLTEIERQAIQANNVKAELRSRFQRAVLNLGSKLMLYHRLQNTVQLADEKNVREGLLEFERKLGKAMDAHMKNMSSDSDPFTALAHDLDRFQFLNHSAEFNPLPLPGSAGEKTEWIAMGDGALMRSRLPLYHPGVLAFADMGDAYRNDNPSAFNAALLDYTSWLKERVPDDIAHARHEFTFNTFEPFYKSMVLYVLVFILAFCSWLFAPAIFNRTAFAVLLLAFTVHTLGLFSRIILQGRPPVTNLYSSAIFVGWGAVLLGIILERLFRRGIGSMVSAVIGFLTLIVAHHLASQGDTMEMMRAVLDSNFWLATHVVCITIGYSSTFLSGALGAVYLARRVWDPTWNEDAAEALSRMVYGIVCFSTFFSFLGTILGGIWADQSWGRFWGWDPKENGALMIVLWNVFILHARWGRLAKQKSIMQMAVFGNVITAFSWFGVNMLGIGLHSYGFMDKAFVWLMIFTVSQLAIMGLAYASPKTGDFQNGA